MQRYFEISKLDEELRMVWGYASTEAVDAQGETVTKAAMTEAWDDYMQFANVREMHKASAVGVVKEYAFDDVGLKIGAHVVDDSAWEKVKTGVYKGFSIGGKKLPGGYDPGTKTITKMRLTEISLVDRPCNPEALIEMFKVDGIDAAPEVEPSASGDTAQAELLALIAKGDVSVERLLQLATQDVTKVVEPVAPAPVVKVEVQKLLATLGDPEAVQKGMYSVGRLADLVESLGWLQRDCAYEAEYEGDKSPLPGELASAVTMLAGVLVRMAQEEVAELVAGLKMDAEADPVTVLGKLFTAADTDGSVAKVMDVLDVVKAGARNSNADATRIQKAHDLLAELGAACGVEKIAKVEGFEAHLHAAVDSGRVQKALQLAEATATENVTLRKSLTNMELQMTEIRKQLEDQPVTPKGALKLIEKGADIDSTLEAAASETVVRKEDGSIDDTATAIMKIHASGGRRVF